VGVFGEPVGWVTVGGIGLVSAGVVTVGLSRQVDRRALGWALATGVTIAMYTVIDAQGVRAAPSAASYIVWVYLLLGGGIGLLFALWRGRAFLVAARREWRPGLAAGVLSLVTYGLALAAYRLGDTPRLAALRETSIVFATAIGIVVLKEQVTAPRMAGITLIVAGAGLLLGAQ
jgi:drug/metabolite transporter (DMT)-like permease